MKPWRWHNLSLHLAVAAVCTTAIYAVFSPLTVADTYVRDILWQRGPIPLVLCFLTFFALSQLAGRLRTALKQQTAMERLTGLWTSGNGLIDSSRAGDMLDALTARVSSTGDFFPFQLAESVLVRYRQTGYVSDSEEALRNAIVQYDDSRRPGDSLIRTIVWVLPMGGFVGTVWGLSGAVRGLSAFVATSEAGQSLGDVLSAVTYYLAIAFDTTLIALVQCIIVATVWGAVHHLEDIALARASHWCSKHLIARLADETERDTTSELAALVQAVYDLLSERLPKSIPG